MWTFLNSLLELLKKINWAAVWNEFIKIPKIIKNLLLIVIVVGICYFAYTYVYTNTNLCHIQQQVDELTTKVESVITTSDYEVDQEYMILTLYLLEELNEQQYQISRTNTQALIRHMKHMDPTEATIIELESSQDRLEQQHLALKRHFRIGIQKFNPSGEWPSELK